VALSKMPVLFDSQNAPRNRALSDCQMVTYYNKLNAVLVLDDAQGNAPEKSTCVVQEGEARESTDTKLKRPVEQVASGTRGGV
jgi:hypothetical protein